MIVGKTAIGRTTVEVLQLNAEERLAVANGFRAMIVHSSSTFATTHLPCVSAFSAEPSIRFITGICCLAECCREQCRLDAVWFLPTAVPPHKQERELTPAAQRIEMLELAIAGNPAFSVCRYEADRGGVNYTVDTLAHFHEEDPSRELFLLLGADMLADLPNWRNAGAGVRVGRCRWPFAGRAAGRSISTACAESPAAERIELMRRHQVEMPEIGISSTDIRRRVASGQSIRYRTPRAVEMYIETHGLYAVGKLGWRGRRVGSSRPAGTVHSRGIARSSEGCSIIRSMGGNARYLATAIPRFWWSAVRFFPNLRVIGPFFALGPPCVRMDVGYIKRFAWTGSTG